MKNLKFINNSTNMCQSCENAYNTVLPTVGKKPKMLSMPSLWSEWVTVILLFIISLSFTGTYGVNPYKKDCISYLLR
jgi:hypothetical protein